jgi:hypothetical protein
MKCIKLTFIAILSMFFMGLAQADGVTPSAKVLINLPSWGDEVQMVNDCLTRGIPNSSTFLPSFEAVSCYHPGQQKGSYYFVLGVGQQPFHSSFLITVLGDNTISCSQTLSGKACSKYFQQIDRYTLNWYNVDAEAKSQSR